MHGTDGTHFTNRWKADYKDTSFKAYIPGIVDGFEESGARPEEIVAEHPLLTYRMVRRFTQEFHELIQQIGRAHV